MSYASKAITNLRFGVIGQALGLVASLITRAIFVRQLGITILGVNSMFTELMSILAVAELGITDATTYALYKPLMKNEKFRISAIMGFFKKVYFIIGCFVLICGLILTCFLRSFIKGNDALPGLEMYFIVFVLSSAATYFMAYRRILVIADQKRYIATIYRYGFFIGICLIQIVSLLVFKSYLTVLVILLIGTIAENFLLSRKVEKMYPYLAVPARLEAEDKKYLTRDIKSVAMHKLGAVIVLSTDNLVLTKFVGLIFVGMYANYLLIIQAIHILSGVVFQAVSASVGSFLAVAERKESLRLVKTMNYLGFHIYSTWAIGFYLLANPVISLWVGSAYLIPSSTLVLISINLYLQGMRQSLLILHDALGLFWYDRYKPIAEAIVNLALALILVNLIGANGVFIATIISTISICLWVEPWVVLKKGLNNAMVPYYLWYLKVTFVAALAFGAAKILIELLPNIGILKVFVGGIIAISCVIAANWIFFHRTHEYQELFAKVKRTVAFGAS